MTTKETNEHVKTAEIERLQAERNELLEICVEAENLFSCLFTTLIEMHSISNHHYTVSIRELLDRLSVATGWNKITKAEKNQASSEPQKTRVKKIECPECCGLGEIPGYTGESIECPVCEGGGEVTVINKGAK